MSKEAVVITGGGRRDARRASTHRPRLPADFVSDGEQILLELLRAREEDEDRLRFVGCQRRPGLATDGESEP